MNRSEKKDFVKKLKEELSSSSSVIVAHYSGITVDETEKLRKEMRDNGAKFKVTKNRLTKLALEDTQFKSIADLFTGPTAIAYSEDPVAPAKVAVSFEKNLANQEKRKQLLNIIGGGIVPSKFMVNNIYNKINQKRKVEIINLNDVFEKDLKLTDKAINTYFEKNKDKYIEIFKSVKIL